MSGGGVLIPDLQDEQDRLLRLQNNKHNKLQKPTSSDNGKLVPSQLEEQVVNIKHVENATQTSLAPVLVAPIASSSYKKMTTPQVPRYVTDDPYSMLVVTMRRTTPLSKFRKIDIAAASKYMLKRLMAAIESWSHAENDGSQIASDYYINNAIKQFLVISFEHKEDDVPEKEEKEMQELAGVRKQNFTYGFGQYRLKGRTLRLPINLQHYNRQGELISMFTHNVVEFDTRCYIKKWTFRTVSVEHLPNF